ncbi:MAG: hypothetical protein J6J38_04935 [Lachnospiraceae bacterium]|nr:hypothetical protein [Lachnospiraceae bacterium]
MTENTYISDALEGNDSKDRLDTEVKKVLSDKTVLAWILKYTTAEFERYSIEKIKTCIEGTPKVGTHPVNPRSKRKNKKTSKDQKNSREKQSPEAITGSDTVDKVPGEGQVYYDIRFYAVTPTKKRIKLILNVEAQKSFTSKYDLVTRGIFYAARMISAQKGTEFKKSNYDDIKKVYSIWICMEVPRNMEYTVTSYRMNRQVLFGTPKKQFRYDLMEVVMICLGREECAGKGNRLHGMLSTLLSRKLTPKEKEKHLSTEYGFETSIELEGGLKQMCNYSEWIEEKGIEKGMLSLIQKKLVKGKSLEQIADELEETVENILPLYEQVKKELNQQ